MKQTIVVRSNLGFIRDISIGEPVNPLLKMLGNKSGLVEKQKAIMGLFQELQVQYPFCEDFKVCHKKEIDLKGQVNAWYEIVGEVTTKTKFPLTYVERVDGKIDQLSDLGEQQIIRHIQEMNNLAFELKQKSESPDLLNDIEIKIKVFEITLDALTRKARRTK